MKRIISVVSADAEIVELARDLGFEVVGYFDPQDRGLCVGAPRLGDDPDWNHVHKKFQDLRVAFAIDFPTERKRLWNFYGEHRAESLVSHHAMVSPSARVGAGSIVQHGCKILARASIGQGCKINVGATVHHDSVVGEFCTLAPGAQILGNVIVGEGVYIGASATILPRRIIGAGAIVGAGAVVAHDVPPGVTVMGIPAREKR